MHRISYIWLCLILTACGTLEVGIERTPTSDPGPAATAQALQTVQALQAERLAAVETRVVALGQQSPSPTPAAEPAPDFGFVAYIQGGDIWVRRVPDGPPLRLTADGRNRSPQWSPSGRWLSFRKDGVLWLIRSDGTGAREIPEVESYRWSPVADHLAYVHQKRAALMLIAEDALPNTDQSGNGVALFEPDGVENQYRQLSEPIWSSDGSQIATSAAQRNTADGALLKTAIWTVTSDGSGTSERYRVDTPTTRLIPIAWSDTETLLIWQIAPDAEEYGTRGLARLAFGSEPSLFEGETLQFLEAIATNPNAPGVVVMRGTGPSTWEQKHLSLISVDGNSRDLTGDDTVALSPAFARDGQRLAYSARPKESDLIDRRIWVRDLAEESRARQITGDAQYRDERPRFSADGQVVLFARMTRDGRASLWIVSVEGGTPIQVVDELTPAPSWWGYDGYIVWEELFDWWTGPVNSPSGA